MRGHILFLPLTSAGKPRASHHGCDVSFGIFLWTFFLKLMRFTSVLILVPEIFIVNGYWVLLKLLLHCVIFLFGLLRGQSTKADVLPCPGQVPPGPGV